MFAYTFYGQFDFVWHFYRDSQSFFKARCSRTNEFNNDHKNKLHAAQLYA